MKPPKPLEMRIVEDAEIQFRGPSLTPGYWEDPEATAAAFTDDGWYKSGDLGAYDDKGRLHLHGRKKDIIVLPNGFASLMGRTYRRRSGTDTASGEITDPRVYRIRMSLLFGIDLSVEDIAALTRIYERIIGKVLG